jgi:predicted transcriptional regulator
MKDERMSPERYQRLIERLGMSRQSAARFLGVDHRTSERYANGEREVPVAVQMLLEHMARQRITPDEIRRSSRLPPVDYHSRPRGNPNWVKGDHQ